MHHIHIKPLANGPYLHALGWTGGPPYAAMARNSAQFSELLPRLSFADNRAALLVRDDADTLKAKLAELPLPFLRSSGVARARNAARSTVFGAMLAKELRATFADNTAIVGDRVGIAMVSSSAIVPIFWRFESVGLADSWQRTDTMLLPASIPSSVVTAASTVTGSHAAALTLTDGAFGMLAGIEHAFLSFFHDRSDAFMVIGGDEAFQPMVDAAASINARIEVLDGAAGMVLTREAVSPGGWQVCFAQTISDKQAPLFDDAWSHADVLRVDCGDRLTAYTAALVPHAIHHALDTDADSVVIDFIVKDRARGLLGLRRNKAA